MKSLVTGGAGFIGSHVARYCRDMGHEVVVLDDLSGGFKDQVPEDVEFVEGCITNQKLVESLFLKHRFDYVYHLAAYAAEGLSHFIRRFNYTNNLIGSVNLINAAVKYEVKCFVFTSSIAVYGAGQVPMIESMVPRPEDPYGISKFAVEMDLAAAHEMFGLNYIIFRPHNVYGENQNIGDKYRNVIGIFMNQIMRKEPMTIFGDGMQTRAFSHIDDLAPQIARSVKVRKAYNEIINIGADKPYSVNELAYVVSSAFGVSPRIKYLTPRNEVQHAYSNHDKAKKIFGRGSGVSLEKGVGRMAQWALKVGARRSAPFKNIEVKMNLPASWQV
ncbi:NAD-dependent epimerase/dehydratase family protein [Pedosphaera parvula]|uniref:NAD-dependent epimerase/dehydratase n=1 Tax=Pedosphaera parvula (strain Ellin514) TaxID=320771 RepID=B9XAX5_PEDPL|nr:NAD-dependent epimerase/dehydratase family protein [Pedosphaera parvula]EEF63160.1 NAD-dependent epimerase/dehydratase [Pedosphaera parvula Ellin514]